MENTLKNGLLPPLTDRGVVKPPSATTQSAENPLIDMLFDWLQVTIQNEKINTIISRIFSVNLEDCIITESGRFGYNRTYTIGSKIHVMENTLRFDMGVHLLISGSACRELEQMMTWKDFFTSLEKFDTFKFTRIDIAIDCYKKFFTISQLRKKVKKREVITKFKNATFMEQINCSTTENESASLKFGSMSSDIYVVFYDKLKERKNAGYQIDSSIDFWHRCEIRFKHDLSTQLYSYYVLNGYSLGIYVQSVLLNYIDFKTINRTRLSRCSTASFWLKFLGNVSKLQLTNKPLQTTIQQKRAYAEMQYSRVVAMISAVDNDFYKSLLEIGSNKINEKDLSIINSHLISENKKAITYEELKKILRMK